MGGDLDDAIPNLGVGGVKQIVGDVKGLISRFIKDESGSVTNPFARQNAENGVGRGRNNVQGGRLLAHENAGGHLIDRHVGKTNQQLTERLNSDSRISAASSFPDETTADRAIGSAINANQNQIDSFLNGSSNRISFDYDTGSSVGNVMQRGNSNSSTVTSVRVVIQRDLNMPDGYRIVTGFPIP